MINRQHLEEILKNNFGKEVKKIEGNCFLLMKMLLGYVILRI